MATSHNSGPVQSDAGFIDGSTQLTNGLGFFIGAQNQFAVPGGLNSVSTNQFLKTAIADSVATDILMVTVPNVACSAVFRLLIRTGITTVGHIYDSTRVAQYWMAITRVPGAAVVAALSAVAGAAQATSSGGQTITSTTPTISAITGAVGALNTFTIPITNIANVAGLTETTILAELMNGAVGGITMSQAA